LPAENIVQAESPHHKKLTFCRSVISIRLGARYSPFNLCDNLNGNWNDRGVVSFRMALFLPYKAIGREQIEGVEGFTDFIPMAFYGNGFGGRLGLLEDELADRFGDIVETLAVGIGGDFYRTDIGRNII